MKTIIKNHGSCFAGQKTAFLFRDFSERCENNIPYFLDLYRFSTRFASFLPRFIEIISASLDLKRTFGGLENFKRCAYK